MASAANVAIVLALGPSVAIADDSCQPPFGTIQCAAGNVVSGATQNFTQSAVQAMTQWVVDTAIWLLTQLVNVILSTSSPSLGADWFHAHYADMVAVAWVLSPIFLLLGILQALLRADIGMFGRILGQLILIALLSTSAVAAAALLIGVVDQLSDFVSRNSGGDLRSFLTVAMVGNFSVAMSGQNTAAGTALPLFFVFLAGLLTVVAGLLIWLELVARTLVIYAALLFFPVLLAAALWPRLSGMVQALAEVLVAVIVSKLIIVVIVAAGVAALTATGGSNAGPSLLVGGGLLLLAAWAPWKLYRLMPALEAAMVHQVGGQFRQSWAQARWRANRMSAGMRRAATRSSGGLKIAGAPVRPPAGQASGVAAAGAVATVGAVAAGAAGAGFRFVRDRVVVGGTPVATRQNPIAGGGYIHLPDGVRNPRPPRGGPAGV